MKLLIALLAATIHAQQFELDWNHSYNQYDLGTSCVDALNSKPACPFELVYLAGKFGDVLNLKTIYYPNPELVSSVCAYQCRATLVRIRSEVEAACGVDATFTALGSIYPITYAADIAIATFDTSCHRHRETGKVCEVPGWTQGSNNDDHVCDDCFLGRIRAGLEHAIAYNVKTEEWLQHLVSECKATGYEFTKPTALPYMSDDPTTKVECMRPYTVSEGDSLDSIALAERVPTAALLAWNQIASRTLPAVGTTICLPDSCKVQWVEDDMDCLRLRQQTNTTMQQLSAWNHYMQAYCDYFHRHKRTYLCVGPPETNQVATPANAAPNSSKQCAQWLTSPGDEYCDALDYGRNLRLQDFFFLNPDLEDYGYNIRAGEAYCVKPVGDITMYPEYLEQHPTMLGSFNSKYVVSAEPTALAPGSESDCPLFENHFDVDEFRKKYGHAQSEAELEYFNSCTSVTSSYGVRLADFVKWNPSLDKESCRLQRGYRYCVKPGIMDDNSHYSWLE